MSQLDSNQVQTVAPTKPAHFTIAAELDGFPLTIELEGKADTLRQMIDRLKAIGATAPNKATAAPAKAAGVPTCAVHGSPMKESRKPGSYFCPKKTGDGYCSEKT